MTDITLIPAPENLDGMKLARVNMIKPGEYWIYGSSDRIIQAGEGYWVISYGGNGGSFAYCSRGHYPTMKSARAACMLDGGSGRVEGSIDRTSCRQRDRGGFDQTVYMDSLLSMLG